MGETFRYSGDDCQHVGFGDGAVLLDDGLRTCTRRNGSRLEEMMMSKRLNDAGLLVLSLELLLMKEDYGNQSNI